MVEPSCPDCDVEMEPVQYRMQAGLSEFLTPYVRPDDARSGLLGRLQSRERLPVRTVRCPACGLLRQYARSDGEA